MAQIRAEWRVNIGHKHNFETIRNTSQRARRHSFVKCSPLAEKDADFFHSAAEETLWGPHGFQASTLWSFSLQLWVLNHTRCTNYTFSVTSVCISLLDLWPFANLLYSSTTLNPFFWSHRENSGRQWAFLPMANNVSSLKKLSTWWSVWVAEKTCSSGRAVPLWSFSLCIYSVIFM